MAYATVEDVAVDYDGDLSDGDTIVKVTVLLERAEARIRQEYRDLEERIADGRTSRVLVQQVETEMVAAVLRNPGGYVSSTSSSTTGPYSETISGTLSTSVASGLLRLTPAHRDLLGDRRGGAFTVAPGSAGHAPQPYGPVRSAAQFPLVNRTERWWR
jgi:hypothetical protein